MKNIYAVARIAVHLQQGEIAMNALSTVAPSESPAYSHVVDLPKHDPDYMGILAGILATGGAMWGALFATLIIVGSSFSALIIALPGYAVTCGYMVRASRRPSVSTKRLIWLSSAIVQGGWLTLFFSTALESEYRLPFFVICLVWWIFASAASLLGLLVDR
jgi:hypothetical protein